MPISLVVFDIAGTTVEDDDAVNVCIREALSAKGISATRDEVNKVMGLPKPEAIAKLANQAGTADLDPAQIRLIHDDFVARSIAHYRHHAGVRETSAPPRFFGRSNVPASRSRSIQDSTAQSPM